jgi:hypothetical protein
MLEQSAYSYGKDNSHEHIYKENGIAAKNPSVATTISNKKLLNGL